MLLLSVGLCEKNKTLVKPFDKMFFSPRLVFAQNDDWIKEFVLWKLKSIAFIAIIEHGKIVSVSIIHNLNKCFPVQLFVKKNFCVGI
jgi:hypothetical protein